MVVPDVFNIVLNNSNRVYQPGQRVSGHIDLHLRKEIKTYGFNLVVYGAAKTHLTETSYGGGGGNRTHTTHYYGSDVYIDEKVSFWGSGNGKSQIIPAGRHILPFSARLPQRCMSSFEGIEGSVQFYCLVTINRAWRSDHTAIEFFTVLSIHDLNLKPSVGLEMHTDCSKSFEFCCCYSGTVFLKINIPKTGYVPGEFIKVALQINNQSSHRMKELSINLFQDIYYKAIKDGYPEEDPEEGEWNPFEEEDGPWEYRKYQNTKSDRRKVCGILANLRDKQAPSNYSLTKDIPIPPVVSTMNAKSSVIQVHYVLQCEIIPTGLWDSRKCQLPIVIGTVPFIQQPSAPQSFRYSGPTPMYLEQGPPQLPYPGSILMYPEQDHSYSPPPPYSAVIDSAPVELPSPSYEECVFSAGSNDIEYERESSFFAPRYPVYRLSRGIGEIIGAFAPGR